MKGESLGSEVQMHTVKSGGRGRPLTASVFSFECTDIRSELWSRKGKGK